MDAVTSIIVITCTTTMMLALALRILGKLPNQLLIFTGIATSAVTLLAQLAAGRGLGTAIAVFTLAAWFAALAVHQAIIRRNARTN
jgi:hypothetical protein